LPACGLIFSPAAEFFWLNWPRSPGGIWQQCLICRLVLHCQTYVQRRASQRLLFTYTAGWSPIAGPVPHGLSSCATTSCLSTLRRTLIFTAMPAAPHKGSGDISAYGTAAVRSASKSDFTSSSYGIKTPMLRGVLWRMALK
jgi:hypothetical protein